MLWSFAPEGCRSTGRWDPLQIVFSVSRRFGCKRVSTESEELRSGRKIDLTLFPVFLVECLFRVVRKKGNQLGSEALFETEKETWVSCYVVNNKQLKLVS